MAWQEIVTVELRQQFVHDARRRVVPVTELCAAYGISRKTGYKFLARYEALGSAGLADQSRRPHRSPTALDPVLLARLLEAQQRHRHWGPRKLLHLVGQRWPRGPLARALHRRPLLPASRTGHCPPAHPTPRARLRPALAVWWIRLGLLPDLTEPGSPHQNGGHERMHLTLKAGVHAAAPTQPRGATALLRSLAPRAQHAPAPRGARRRDPGVGLPAVPSTYPARLPRWSIPPTTRSAG